MGKIAKNKFTKGLLRDISLDKFPNDAYFSLTDGRILSTGTLSSGSIENLVGNSLFFSLPTTPNILKCTPVFGAGLNTTVTILIFSTGSTSVVTTVSIGNVSVEEASRLIVRAIKDQTTNPNILAFTDGADIQISSNKSEGLSVIIQDSNGTPIYTVTETTQSRSGTSLKIIGGRTIRDSIILYSTSDNGDGQVWIVNYDPSLFTTTYKIVYNNDGANFSSDHPIGDEIIGLYETQRIQRAYWTDNNEPPRRLNTADEDSYFLSPDELSNAASVKFTRPIVNRITMDGILPSGVYQYGYVLKSFTTSLKTSVSPLSAVANIVVANESTAVLWGLNSSDPLEYKGGPPGQPTGKSISGTITDLGGDAFDMIDIIAFYKDDYKRTWTSANIFIRDLPIPNDGVVNFKHTGTETNEPFVVDVNFFFNKVVTRVKTIATKKNVLLYGNIKLAGNENLKFNARAYRYKIDGSTYVDDTATDENHPLWNKDAINPYNTFGHEDAIFYPAQDTLFKYKKGTSILGGSGPNVSYEFFVEMLDGDKYNSDDAGANQIPLNYPWITKDRVTKTIDLGIDGEKYVNDNFFYDYKSPYVNLALRGYMPGEIYRFALLTYDKSGNPAFVNWIGDIKFPEISEMESIGTNTGYSRIINGIHTIGTMGVRFNLSGIPANVRANMGGCRIVRCFRGDSDMTRFGTGIMSIMRKAHITEFNNNIGADTTSGDDFYCYSNDFHNFPTGTEIYGDTINLYPLISSWYSLFFTGKDSSFTDSDIIYSFDSPVFQYEQGAVTFTTGEQIRVEGILGLPQSRNDIHDWAADPNQKGSIYKYYSLFPLINVPSQPKYFSISGFDALGTLGSVSPTSIGMSAYNFAFNPANIDTGVTVSASGAKSRVLYRASTSYGNYTVLMNFSNSGSLYQYFRYGIPDVGEGGDDNIIKTRKVLATYCRSLAKQYGGAEENARDNNIYYGCSNFMPTEKIPTGLFKVFGGDIYTNICDSIKGGMGDMAIANSGANPHTTFNGRLLKNDGGAQADPDNWKRFVAWFYPVMSGYNIDLRTGTHFVNKIEQPTNLHYYTQSNNLFEDYWYSGSGYGTYSNWDTCFSFNPEPSVIEFEDEFDNMVMASEKKITGERFDKWSQFTGTNILVDGIYGPINRLSAFKDNIYFHQDKAFGRISVFPRAAVPNIGTDSSSIGLQEGSVLNDYAYISNVSGTKHQFSVIVSANALYWADVVSKKIMRFDEQQGTRALSDIYALKSYCADKMSGSLESTDDILNGIGIVSGFDHINNQHITTFLNGAKSDTIAFNETIDNFETRFSFIPNLYIGDRRNMFTVRTDNQLYVHNRGNRGQFYGTIYPMDVEVIFNPEPEVSKVLDVLQFTTEVYNSSGVDVPTDTLDYVRWSNDYQDSGILALDATNIKRRLRTWHIGTIRDTTKNTIRGHFAKLWFRYDNLNNNRIILHDIISLYRSIGI